jgi:hypothetical protein
MALGLRKISRIISFPHFFFSLLKDIHLIFGTLLCHAKIQIKFEFCFDPLVFPEVMAIGLRKISRNYLFSTHFSLCLQIFILYLVHLLCHTKIQIKFEFGFDPLIFPYVMALGLRKISRIISFPHFFLSAYGYSFNICTLLCHTNL